MNISKYCKEQHCIKAETLKLSTPFNQIQISSKMAYSQNIRNRVSKFTTNYNNYINTTSSTSSSTSSSITSSTVPTTPLLCTNSNSNIKKSPFGTCKLLTISETSTAQSYFLRNFISNKIKEYTNHNISDTLMNQYISDITNLYSENPNTPFNQLVYNYLQNI
jgi:hypothetical protein